MGPPLRDPPASVVESACDGQGPVVSARGGIAIESTAERGLCRTCGVVCCRGAGSDAGRRPAMVSTDRPSTGYLAGDLGRVGFLRRWGCSPKDRRWPRSVARRRLTEPQAPAGRMAVTECGPAANTTRTVLAPTRPVGEPRTMDAHLDNEHASTGPRQVIVGGVDEVVVIVESAVVPLAEIGAAPTPPAPTRQ